MAEWPNRSKQHCLQQGASLKHIEALKNNTLLGKVINRQINGVASMWLGADLDGARDLLAPLPASEMISHAVSYDVNHPRIDEEYLVTPVEPNLGVTLRLF